MCCDGFGSCMGIDVREWSAKGRRRVSCTRRSRCVMVWPRESEVCREGPDVEAEEENIDDILNSGSKRKPVTHIRAKASRL